MPKGSPKKILSEQELKEQAQNAPSKAKKILGIIEEGGRNKLLLRLKR